MSTEAQKRASINYNKRQDCITLRPSKEKGQEIRAAAAAAGQPLQAYVLQAVQDRIEKEKAGE